ncbi:MAG: hypothetical protein SangKO_078280 [Sandaracinaceae bacterium]
MSLEPVRTDAPLVNAPFNPRIDLGPARAWAGDLALVGAITTVALGLVTPIGVKVALVTAALAALGGGLLGAVVPWLLSFRVRRKPWLVLALAAAGLGACWGGAAGLVASELTGHHGFRASASAATALALQLGWLWLPLTIGRARGGDVHGWVAFAGVLAPLVAWVAYQHVTW